MSELGAKKSWNSNRRKKQRKDYSSHNCGSRSSSSSRSRHHRDKENYAPNDNRMVETHRAKAQKVAKEAASAKRKAEKPEPGRRQKASRKTPEEEEEEMKNKLEEEINPHDEEPMAHDSDTMTIGDDKEDDDANLKEQNKQQADEIAKLQAQLMQKRADLKVKRRGGRKTRKNEMTSDERQWQAAVWLATKYVAWNVLKFINSDKKLVNVTTKVMEHMQLEEFEGLQGKRLAAKQAMWIAENKDLVRQAINHFRNYHAGQVRAEWVSRKIMDKPVPTKEQILDCATREPNLLKTEEGKALLADYHDVWLQKIAGKEHWERNQRYYQTISNAKHDGCKENPECINSGTEAFLYLVYENCEPTKWEYLAECKKLGKTVDNKHQAMMTVYTVSDGGQMEWGGWTKAGHDCWKEVKQKIEDAHQHEHVTEMEKQILHLVHVRNKLVKDDKPDVAVAAAARKYEIESDDEDDEFA